MSEQETRTHGGDFQVGDPVEVLPAQAGSDSDWRRVSGQSGVVRVGRVAWGMSVGVQFLGFTKGHRLEGLLPEGSHEGWWCDPVWLRRVPAQEKVVHVTAGPRYKVGDLVDGDEFQGGEVREVEPEPIYVVRWPSGYVQRLKESALSPHKPLPVVCTPMQGGDIKTDDLLLTPEEQGAILAEGLLSDMTRSDALCRAQAAKVLAELVRLLPHRDYKQVLDLSTGEAVCAQGCAPCAVGEVIEAAGLTWPPREDFGTYGGVETLPPKEG